MKIIYRIQFFFLISVFLVSCTKDISNETFSCDKSIDKWAHDNYKSLSVISKSELAKLTGENQIAAFRTLSPEKKAEIVKQKLNEILGLKWTDKEREHLNLLSNNISSAWYEENTNDNKFYKMALHSWIKEWTFYCRDSLSWSRELVFSIGCRFDTPVSSEGYLLETPITDVVDPVGNCKCSTDDDWCSLFKYCKAGNCKEGPGCGLFWNYNCDGLCG